MIVRNDSTPKNIRVFSKGEYLFHQGDPTQVLFIVKTGSVRIFKVESNIEFDLATATAGTVLGEITMIDRGLRSASGIAAEDTVVIAITASEFDAVFSKMPEWFRKIALILVQRLREVDQKIKKTFTGDIEDRISALIALLLAGDQSTKTENGFELSLKFLEDEIMDILNIQPSDIESALDSLSRQGFIRTNHLMVNVLLKDAIEAKARNILHV